MYYFDPESDREAEYSAGLMQGKCDLDYGVYDPERYDETTLFAEGYLSLENTTSAPVKTGW